MVLFDQIYYFAYYSSGVELEEFNVPLDTQKVISETSLSSQSLGYGTDKTNLQQRR